MIARIRFPRWTTATAPSMATVVARCFWGGCVACFLFWVVVGVAYLEMTMRDGVREIDRLERSIAYWPRPEPER